MAYVKIVNLLKVFMEKHTTKHFRTYPELYLM